MRGAVLALLLCLAASGCGGGGSKPPSPTTTGTPPTSPAPTTTVARVPTLSAAPIPGLGTATFHGSLEKIGFAKPTVGGTAEFVTTTSKKADATVTTYGKGPTEVVKIVAEADKAAAPTVLAAVARSAVKGADAKKAEAWVKAELKKKGPTSAAQPRAAKATYAKLPYALLVTTSTATLSIGRLTA